MSPLLKLVKQPNILAYLLAGILVGPLGLAFIRSQAEIETVSEIGLILLLFMVGLELDLRKMISGGKYILVPGIIQFPLSLLIGFLILKAVAFWGFAPKLMSWDLIYIAVAVSLSSTMVVVKLLLEKMELNSFVGRVTLGILIFQDIWTMIVLAIQPNLHNPDVWRISQTFAMGTLLVAGSLASTKYVLPRVFRFASGNPELVLLLALGWCFLLSLIAATPVVGLSMEMGALIAGISLATFPYTIDVFSKMVSIRDFFIVLFFVSLGMQIPTPTTSTMSVVLVVAILVLVLRFLCIFLPLYFLKTGMRSSLIAGINLSQISEFSLVFCALGLKFGHIQKEAMTVVIWVFALLAVNSTLFIGKNFSIYVWMSKVLKPFGFMDRQTHKHTDISRKNYPVVFLGYYSIADAFMREFEKKHAEMINDIMVIDHNPVTKQKLDKMGIPHIYGDLSNKEVLSHAHIQDAKLVVCSMSDAFLRGTSNLKLLRIIQSISPNAFTVFTADNRATADALYQAGASLVLEPVEMASMTLVSTVHFTLLREAKLASKED